MLLTVTKNVPSEMPEYAARGPRATTLESEYHVVASADVKPIRQPCVKPISEKLRPVMMNTGAAEPGRLLRAESSTASAAPPTTGPSYENTSDRVPNESENVPLLHNVTVIPRKSPMPAET